ncbi:MAG: FAD-binding domain-containing protein [Rubrivivax sp.]
MPSRGRATSAYTCASAPSPFAASCAGRTSASQPACAAPRRGFPNSCGASSPPAASCTHHPHVAGAAFKPAYDRIRWHHGKQAEAHFAAWCRRTGYPLVDAAMQQINWSQARNRLRMVTASSEGPRHRLAPRRGVLRACT